jgi:hypothetical protein
MHPPGHGRLNKNILKILIAAISRPEAEILADLFKNFNF